MATDSTEIIIFQEQTTAGSYKSGCGTITVAMLTGRAGCLCRRFHSLLVIRRHKGARRPTRLTIHLSRPPQTSPAGREYNIPSPLHRFLAEMVDFFILFCVKATIVLWIMHLSGMKDISKIVMQFVVEEIDENTSLEDLQKMMAVALVYRVLVCFYEIICIWGAGGATPGKFLLGLRVVTCDSIVLVRPNRVLVVPASNVTLSASTVRALNKNLSIAFLFPVFITLLFFQHNRTVYDIVAGTIVVRRRGAR
ncbi:protein FAM8A1 isoform X2 [Electrophorus electricus]|uniref:protein FAM8A1 isoform X2 n=1 Tax=Electrophorus electricus TaxID=8005 RepID=UPI0015D059F5|nr:protein FAM8A1 isoform X2 [Electrophorus electricus]